MVDEGCAGGNGCLGLLCVLVVSMCLGGCARSVLICAGGV